MWILKQRSEYEKLREGKSSILTIQRIQRMNDLGFDWNKEKFKRFSFEERIAQLAAFKEKFGECY